MQAIMRQSLIELCVHGLLRLHTAVGGIVVDSANVRSREVFTKYILQDKDSTEETIIADVADHCLPINIHLYTKHIATIPENKTTALYIIAIKDDSEDRFSVDNRSEISKYIRLLQDLTTGLHISISSDEFRGEYIVHQIDFQTSPNDGSAYGIVMYLQKL